MRGYEAKAKFMQHFEHGLHQTKHPIAFPTMAVILSATWSILALAASVFLWSYLNSPLRQFPGPILARFTNIWRLLDVYRGRCDRTHLRLHRKHGSVVRTGPNVLSLSDPGLINRVYTTKGAWAKVGGSLNLFLWLYTDECTNRS